MSNEELIEFLRLSVEEAKALGHKLALKRSGLHESVRKGKTLKFSKEK